MGPSTENRPVSKSMTIRKNGSVGLGSDMARSTTDIHHDKDVIIREIHP
jgi:hypothetical protein